MNTYEYLEGKKKKKRNESSMSRILMNTLPEAMTTTTKRSLNMWCLCNITYNAYNFIFMFFQ